ncbi:MAG: hypothetical protein E6G97_12820 [Alphaproteobacteria bacterium]|nr:MAG: hypothetical protein E6G97_12820 [Alphaproteobacteria bacterium]
MTEAPQPSGFLLPFKLAVFVRNVLAHSAGLYLRAMLAALAAIALFFAMSYASSFVDRGEIAAKLEAANARHAFRQTWAAGSGRAIPRFGGNDCLLLAALLQAYPSRAAQTISARIPPADAQPPARAGDPTIPACLQLIAALERRDHADPNAVYYHRYLHGQRVFAALALAVAFPEALGRFTLLANVVCLLLVLVPALRRWRTGERRERGFAAIAATLLLFDGLWLFGIYFSFGLSDLVLSLFLLYAYRRGTAQVSEPAFASAVALFGVATAVFEFLTGGIPFGLALLLGIVALDSPDDRAALLRRAFHGTAIFALAILATFAVKLALVMLVIDPAVLAEFRAALLTRTGSSFVANLPPQEVAWVARFGIDVSSLDRHWIFALAYMLARLAYATFVIGYGSPILGMVIMGTAAVTTTVLLIRRAHSADGPIARTRLLILFASALAMPVWSLVFLSHTLLHAIWMVRPFAWFIALAGILVSWPRRQRLHG